MKIQFMLVIAVLMIVSCGGAPVQKKPETPKVETSAADVKGAAFDAARAEFKKVVKDIPFNVNSSSLALSDPKYTVNGQNVDSFMKKALIPALSKVVNVMPVDKKVVIDGHASKTGTEEASKGFIGNIALSKKRGDAVLNYILKNSELDGSKFIVRANGSSKTIPGIDSSDEKNCRVSLDIE